MKYSIGEIVVCCSNDVAGYMNKKNLIIGDKYYVNDLTVLSDGLIIFDLTHVDSKNNIGLYSSRNFISLSSYRTWKINQLLN